MADIKVRVGQQNAIKVVASNNIAANLTLGVINDVDITNRSNRTFLMYNSATQTYIHVPADQIVDLADNLDDDSYDAGSF